MDRALLVVDIPFGTYQETLVRRLVTIHLAEIGGHAVKLEGGARLLNRFSESYAGIP